MSIKRKIRLPKLTSGYMYYTFQRLPQFWHMATVSFLNLVFPVLFRLPTSNHKPHVQMISIQRQIVHRHPMPLPFVFADVCSSVTLTLSLPHLGHVII